MGTGRLIMQLGIAAYILFTLLPDSSTQMVAFPWVLLWQIGLLCLAIAGLLNLWRWDRPFYLLGNGLDWAIAAAFVTLCLSTIFSQFPDQAMWYSLTAFGYGVAIYVTNNFLHGKSGHTPPLGILRFQGILGIAVILVSLGLWTTQIWIPQLQNLAQLNQWGLNLSYDFSEIESRNGVPMGHQNYVAGFLILVLPIMTSLAIAQKGIWRSIWLIGIGLGLIDLYTTSSRGGFLGLGVIVIYGITLAIALQGRRWWVIGGGIGAIALIAVLISANNRLRSLIIGLVTSLSNPAQGSGELLFRAIAADVGWRIGLDHWLFGAGAGSAVMLYQQYRPQWAGREAEILFQLHSTPVQIWAELGIGAVITCLLLFMAIARIMIRLHRSPSWQASLQDRILTYGLLGSLLGYITLAITDYQLDVPAISGSLVIVLASLAYLGQIHTGELITLGYYKRPRMGLAMIATIYLGAAIAWLVPVNVAWQASSVGFLSLAKAQSALADSSSANPDNISGAIANVERFQNRLQLAQQLAPWEPYYPYQLGINLAELALNYPALPQAPAWRTAGLEWVKKSISVNPYNESGYNAAAWLSLQQNNPTADREAEAFFRNGLKLHPLKRSLSFGLGVSLLRQGKKPEAIAAMAEEVAAEPIFITSPQWANADFQAVYPQVVAKLNQVYGENNPSQLAALRWWTGQASRADALNELKQTGNATAILLAQAIANDTQALTSVQQNPQTPAEMVVSAWLNPNLREKLLERAYVFATRSVPDEKSKLVVTALSDRMASAKTFDDWFNQPIAPNSPLVINYRRARLGFGVVSRHMDGTIPLDFYNVSDRADISLFFKDLFS